MEDIYRSQFRLPYSLYERLKAAADANRRSVNAELVARLEESFATDMHRFIKSNVMPAAEGSGLELEELQLNLEIVLEQVKHIKAAMGK